MAKEQLQERFQKLAGIKSITVLKEEEVTEQFMNRVNENPLLKEELFTALAGLAGILGMAGVTSQMQMALEDPAIAEKYPSLVKIFGFLTSIGNAVGPGIK